MRLYVVLWSLLLAVMAAGAVRADANKESDYRTKVPQITPSRWLRSPSPMPKPGRITREDYMEFIRRTYEGGRESALRVAGSPEHKNQYIYARREAFFYQATKDERHARLALKFIRGDYAYHTQGKGKDEETHFAMFAPAVEAYWWIRSCPALTKQDHELCKRWLLMLNEKNKHLEYGAMNRSTGSALGRMVAAMLFPDNPEAAQWRRYADTVWNDWWKFRDTDENSTGYNGLWWHYITTWLNVADKEDLYQDPGMKKLIYRFLAQATPLGPTPYFGDVCGWNSSPGQWIALMEKWATVYHDGSFKWVAHRLFEWTAPQEEQMWQWGNINQNMMDGLMDAYLAADDSIEEVPPDLGSVVTYRKALRWSSREERQRTGYHAFLTDRVIPNKLIFRTGWQPDDTYALVELCPPMGHGQSDAGSINCLVSKGSVLLADTPYLVKDHSFHNCFIVKPAAEPKERWRWSHEKLARMKISVEDFHASRKVACASLRVGRYMDQPVTLERRIFFLGDEGLWVRDRLVADEPYEARIGPAWQTTHVYGERADNWVNTCMVTLPVAYIWELKYMMQWKNRPWDLLVYFMPHPGANVVIDDVTHDETRCIVDKPLMNNFKKRVWYTRTAKLLPNEPHLFSTVLIPHKPTADASPLAKGIEPVLDGDDAAVVKIAPDADRQLWVGFNRSGKVLQAQRIATDAKWFMVIVDGAGATGYWLVDATYLEVDGHKVFSSASPRTVDTTSGGGE